MIQKILPLPAVNNQTLMCTDQRIFREYEKEGNGEGGGGGGLVLQILLLRFHTTQLPILQRNILQAQKNALTLFQCSEVVDGLISYQKNPVNSIPE
jgi:hypothetical protein